MALVGGDSRLGPEGLVALYREHRAAIAELGEEFGEDSGTIVDLPRWMTGRALAEDLLHLLPEDPSQIPSDRLRDHVNVAYDAMIVLIDLRKLAYGLRRVPAQKPT